MQGNKKQKGKLLGWGCAILNKVIKVLLQKFEEGEEGGT